MGSLRGTEGKASCGLGEQRRGGSPGRAERRQRCEDGNVDKRDEDVKKTGLLKRGTCRGLPCGRKWKNTTYGARLTVNQLRSPDLK